MPAPPTPASASTPASTSPPASTPLAATAGALAAAAGGIAILTVLARIAGFGRTAALAAVVGQTCVADSYLTANQLPNVVFEVVAGGALAATVVPLVGRALAPAAGRGAVPGPARHTIADPAVHPDSAPDPDAGLGAAVRTLSALLGWVLLLLVPAAVVCAFAAPALGRALAGGGCDGQAALVGRMLVVFAPQIPLYGLTVLAAGLLQATRRFTAAAAAPLVSSLVVVGGYLLFARTLAGAGVPAPGALSRPSLLALAGGTTAGVLALCVTVVAAAGRLPVARAVRPTLRFPPGAGRLALRLAGAGLAAVAAAQGAALVVTVIANHRGGPGTLAVYSYALAVSVLPAAVLTTPVTTSVLPRVVVAEPAAGVRLAAGSLAVVVLLGLAGAAVLFATAPEVGKVFDGGAGGAGGTGVGSALAWLALGVPGVAVLTHLARLTAALRRPGLAAATGTLGWVLAAAGALVAGVAVTRDHLAADHLAAALAAATAAGLLGGGVFAVAGWARLTGRAGLVACAVPAAVGIPAAAVGAVAGRLAGSATSGTVTLGSAAGSAGGVAADLRALSAAVVAAVVTLAVAAVLGGGGARLTGHRLSLSMVTGTARASR